MASIKNFPHETSPADDDLVWGGKAAEGPDDGRVYTFATIAAKVQMLTYSQLLYDASGGYILWAKYPGLSSTQWVIRRLSNGTLATPANNSSASDAASAWASRETLVYG